MSAAAFPHEAPPVHDDMSEQTETRYERRRPWSDPGIILQFIALMLAFVQMFVLVCGALLGSYMFLRTSATTSEISNATLNEKLNKISADVDGITRKMDTDSAERQAIVNRNTEQQGAIDLHAKQIDGITRKLELQDVYNSNFTKELTRLQTERK